MLIGEHCCSLRCFLAMVDFDRTNGIYTVRFLPYGPYAHLARQMQAEVRASKAMA